MKKLFLVLLPLLLFVGCADSNPVYVDVNSGQKVNKPGETATRVTVYDFIDLKTICKNDCYIIRVDSNTDILYVYSREFTYGVGLSPIMKPDGTCLTYSEWKSNRNK